MTSRFPTSGSVTVDVPVRVCDVGGWTDTWFAEHGRVCSLAVEPGVRVRAASEPGNGAVTIEVADYAVAFRVGRAPAEHRLLQEAVLEAGALGAVDARIEVTSAVPPASSLGTSAAVCVGVIAALDALRGAVRPPAELAAAAHRAEAERLGRQSGVQDQAAAAHGGANLVEVPSYPRAEVLPIRLASPLWDALDARLVHVAYGSLHDSSAVHLEVIEGLRAEGPSSARLQRLRALADQARAALQAADLDAYGEVLEQATLAQIGLHPGLVSDDASTLIDAARSCGALGWKVNGAGGGGGSVSILCRHPTDRPSVVAEVEALGHEVLPLSLARRGARVVEG